MEIHTFADKLRFFMAKFVIKQTLITIGQLSAVLIITPIIWLVTVPEWSPWFIINPLPLPLRSLVIPSYPGSCLSCQLPGKPSLLLGGDGGQVSRVTRAGLDSLLPGHLDVEKEIPR